MPNILFFRKRSVLMNQITLGRRIREARLAKKMTQSEVVGTFITRNMLSQIESGSASPSIKTLEYLSKVLEIPLPDLMADEESSVGNPEINNPDTKVALSNTPTDSYLILKQNFLLKNYEEIPILIEEYLQESHPFYDEGCAVYARSCLLLGLKNYESGQYRQALHFAKEANRYAQLGCLASRDVKTQALLLLDSITEKM